MRKFFSILLCAAVLLACPAAAYDLDCGGVDIPAPHAVLMEKESGAVLLEKAADERVYPASVTKIMTILLIVEAIESGRLSLDDMVTASANAADMGGSQIYLEEGESMSVRDMLKSIVVSSANDAAVAMAEHMRGSEKAFAADMNARAAELGMENTNFNNCTGLFDDDGHYTTAMDVALMARELIKHDMVKEYTTIWMDSVRGGEFGLTNTNRLVSRYDGCTGLKTGFTSRAGHCLAATAERGGAEYIAVVMNCQSSDDRFNSASQLLDYAFANYTLVPMRPNEAIPPVVVRVGETGSLQPQTEGAASVLVKKDDAGAVEFELTLPPAVEAPVEQGQTLGTLRAKINGEVIAEARLTAGEAVARRSPVDIFRELFGLLYG